MKLAGLYNARYECGQVPFEVTLERRLERTVAQEKEERVEVHHNLIREKDKEVPASYCVHWSEAILLTHSRSHWQVPVEQVVIKENVKNIQVLKAVEPRIVEQEQVLIQCQTYPVDCSTDYPSVVCANRNKLLW